MKINSKVVSLRKDKHKSHREGLLLSVNLIWDWTAQKFHWATAFSSFIQNQITQYFHRAFGESQLFS